MNVAMHVSLENTEKTQFLKPWLSLPVSTSHLKSSKEIRWEFPPSISG